MRLLGLALALPYGVIAYMVAGKMGLLGEAQRSANARSPPAPPSALAKVTEQDSHQGMNTAAHSALQLDGTPAQLPPAQQLASTCALPAASCACEQLGLPPAPAPPDATMGTGAQVPLQKHCRSSEHSARLAELSLNLSRPLALKYRLK